MPFADAGDARIFYDVEGDGPPLVFLHGGGSNAAGWFQQVGHFRGSHRCITIDNRCFGKSEPVDPEIYWPKKFAGDVLEVLDLLGVGSAAFVCQSLGGWTGLRLALAHPDRVTHLVVSDSPMGIDSEEAREDAQRFARSIGEEGGDIETAVLDARFRESRPEMVYLYRQISAFNRLNHGPLPMHERTQRLYAPDYVVAKERLRDVSCPTMLIVGATDRIVTPTTMKGFADLIPGARLEIVEGAAHSPYWETPDHFNALVASFLAPAAAA